MEEKELWSGNPALRNWWPSIFLSLALTGLSPCAYSRGLGRWSLFPLLAGLVCLARVLLLRLSRRYIITNERIISVSGLLARTRAEIELKDVRHLNMRQSLWQRLCGMGDVEIESVVGTENELRIVGVAGPQRLLESIHRARQTGDVPPAAASPSR